jgi:branched-chain amino acid transport system permease protein
MPFNLWVDGLTLGAIYGMVNLGFVLLYRTTGVINFAQGSMMAVGAYALTSTVNHVPYGLGLFLSCALVAVICAASYYLLMRVFVGAGEFTKVIATLLLSIVVEQITFIVWGTGTRILPNPTTSKVDIFGHSVQLTQIIIVLSTFVAFALVALFLNRTVNGLRMQQIAQNEVLATYGGVSLHALAGVAWLVTGVTAALAGIFFAQGASAGTGLAAIGLTAFPAAVIGGFGSFGGTLLGCFIVSYLQTFSSYHLSATWSDLLIWAVMVLFLVARPNGLFGRTVSGRI